MNAPNKPICSNCGLEVQSYSRTCNWCGQKLDSESTIPLFAGLMILLRNPSEFFEKLKEFSPTFMVMYLGYYLFCFVRNINAETIKVFSKPNAINEIFHIISTAFIGSFLAAFLIIPFLVMIWMFMSSKILKGIADATTTIVSIGYAILWPGIFSLICVLLYIVSLVISNKSLFNGAFYLQNIFGFWSIINSGIAIKNINKFSIKKTLVVILWPLVPISLLLVSRLVA